MGVLGRLIGLGEAGRALGAAGRDLAEVFRVNATAEMEAAAALRRAALEELGRELAVARAGWWDRLVDGLNRLPRPLMALGTLGLFAHAMIDPAGFAERMRGLATVPEPLWWLLGAVVGFYFGARELHYRRGAALAAALAVMGLIALAFLAFILFTS
ncbi:MAG: hypothetical protein D6832_00420, partial [Alphaproteobacteria bacterium]